MQLILLIVGKLATSKRNVDKRQRDTKGIWKDLQQSSGWKPRAETKEFAVGNLT